MIDFLEKLFLLYSNAVLSLNSKKNLLAGFELHHAVYIIYNIINTNAK